VSTETQEYITTVVTVSGGQTISSVVTSDRLITHTTGWATITSNPTLGYNTGSSNNSSGLSTSTKSIIGGVVGGIGGAIVLGGLLVVAWRLWGRKKGKTQDDDDYFSGSDNGVASEKRRNHFGFGKKGGYAPGTSTSPERGDYNTSHNF